MSPKELTGEVEVSAIRGGCSSNSGWSVVGLLVASSRALVSSKVFHKLLIEPLLEARSG